MPMRNAALRTLLLALGCAASWFLLKRAFPPYLWLAVLWSAITALQFATSAGRLRVVWFNLAAVIVALGAGEFLAWRNTPAGALRTESSPGFIGSHPFLGNAPNGPGVHTVTRYDEGAPSFRVSYSIDSLGWRETPAHRDSGPDTESIVFFGCSLTFGEGVPDSATLPAQTGLRSRSRYRAHNFGFSGYGPHQMLAILEHRLESPALSQPPAMAVYLAIPGHVYRVLGRTTWDPGPRYRLQPDGSVRFEGRFHSPLASRALNVLYRSFLLSRGIEAWNRRLGTEDYELYFGVVAAARREFQARYPGSEFLVLYWDTRSESAEARNMDERLLAGLASRGIRAVPASRMLPEYPREARRYLLSPNDPHPNALAYRMLAEYLLDSVLTARGSPATGGRYREGSLKPTVAPNPKARPNR